MKKYFYVLFGFFVFTLTFYSLKVEAIMPLTGKKIIIDPGHGAEDPGTSYGNLYEKDINLSISLYLEKILGSLGAEVLLTRNGDYDLSSPNALYRKKSDFDNRIKMINESNSDIYISIHLNYLSDSAYSGPQVFYNKENENLAKIIQNNLNNYTKGTRKIKKIPQDTYMYNKLQISGVLIECGFLSNPRERNLLKSHDYQKELAKSIAKGILQYFSN